MTGRLLFEIHKKSEMYGRRRMNGKTKKIIQWTAGVIFSLLIIFVILISSFEIVLYSDMSVYRKEYEKYEVLDELDMTMDDAMYVTRE
mgnify:FL=1